MSRRALRLLLVSLLACLGLGALALPGSALAHWGEEKYRIEGRSRPDRPVDGPHGRAKIDIPGGLLRLEPSSEGLIAKFDLTNVGDGPLQVFRIGPEIDPVPRAAQGLGVTSTARESKPLAPGEKRSYTIRWRSEESRAQQLQAFVVIESDSAGPGASEYDPPLSFSIVADRRPASMRHILSIVTFSPLLVAIAALLLSRRLSERALRSVCATLAALSSAIAIVPLSTFSRLLTREDGGWGLQHVERFRAFGDTEYFVGLDGVSAAVLPLPAVVLFAAVAAARTPRGGFAGMTAIASVATAAVTLFTVSQSTVVSAFAFVVACCCLVALAARSTEPGPAGRAATLKLAIALLVASAAFVWLVVAISKNVYPSRLVDGRSVGAAVLPDIAREAVHGHPLLPGPRTLLGLPFERGALLLALVAFGALGALIPLQASLRDLSVRSSGSVIALVTGLTAIASGVGMIRFSIALFPSASSWLARPVAIVALPTLLLAGLRAVTEDDLRRLIVHLHVAGSAVFFLSVASMTPQGIEGGIAITAVRAVGVPACLLLAHAMTQRTGEASIEHGGGLAHVAPRWAAAWLVALASVAALPGSGGFWALVLSVIGVVGRTPWVALLLTAGAALTALGGARSLAILLDPAPRWWRTSTHLEPHGGVVPDLRRDELAWVVVMLGVLVLATFASGSWLGLADATILDVYRLLDAPGATQVS